MQLAIPPGGEEKARRFYGEVLGMAELPKPPVLAARGGAWFRRDGVEVHLGVEDDFRPASKAHPGIAVEDIDAVAAQLTRSGVAVSWDDLLPGHRRFFTSDPFDNRLEFLAPKS